MMYVHHFSTVNIQQDQEVDIKSECKKVAPSFVRRTDRFIQLGLLGVSGIKHQCNIAKETALFMASGQGNLSVFNRLCQQRYVEQVPPKPVDFINSLSNTAGFYIANYLGLKSKNINLAQQGFVVENTLLLAKASLLTQQEQQILVGGVDERSDVSNQPHDYLKLPNGSSLGDGSNWMLLNRHRVGAIAAIDLHNQLFDEQALRLYLAENRIFSHVAFGYRIHGELINAMVDEMDYQYFNYQQHCDFYETNALFALNLFMEKQKGHLVFIDNFESKYRVITLNVY